ncbi:MAG: hypothetical protein PHO08_15680 [Methylococcales bacterium]|nr:hypothetical protein [Methylococcales bacterium]MDD5631570.1 hypothetical protein [Methylococcales bacterium]
MKQFTDLTQYKGVLPYASEIFGVYQPLLGWKSKRTVDRFQSGFKNERLSVYGKVISRFKSDVHIATDARSIQIPRLGFGPYAPEPGTAFSSVLLGELAKLFPSDDDPRSWEKLTPELIQNVLDGPVKSSAISQYPILWDSQQRQSVARLSPDAENTIRDQLARESSLAGLILELKVQGAYTDLRHLVHAGTSLMLAGALGTLGYSNPLDSLDPHKDINRVGLSPVGIVHLFRQFFFELDTFLGTPMSHVWMSPGATVELIEVSTRKTIIEKTQESSLSTRSSSEQSTSAQDDLSDAVKEENRSNTKFGASVSASESWIWGSANESASFDMGTTQQTARETAHKQMRQQSAKLSEEIKKDFKSTFKTVTEVIDTSSKRYVLANTTDHLINYELRRKMRQVGVQVQDIGSYLCWQTYVDDPGATLGVANLVHIGEPPQFQGDSNPEATPTAQPISDKPIPIKFTWPYDDDTLVFGFVLATVIQISPPKPQYVYDRYQIDLLSGQQWGFVALPQDYHDIDDGAGKKESVPNSLNIGIQCPPKGLQSGDDFPEFTLQITIFYKPSQALLKETDTANAAKVAAANNEKVRAYKEAFLKASRDRINAASGVKARPYEDLREEERIVVYRSLVQNLLTKGLTIPDASTRHIVAELLSEIFDVDKMLYFVAPEWWSPRLHSSHQSFGSKKQQLNIDGTPTLDKYGNPIFVPESRSSISVDEIANWSGGQAARDANYYITEDSASAKLGSSLGWLLQLDGDNLRNAFLNAPWVKAVIPIRPGKEKAALNWLRHVEGMNGIGPSDIYSGPEQDWQGKPMIEVLNHLAEKVAEKHVESSKIRDFIDPAAPGDPASTVTATPVDRVCEHGFYPLQGGFRITPGTDPGAPLPHTGNFEVFDQWIEILPTDQIVPVEVKYDPKTGRQV